MWKSHDGSHDEQEAVKPQPKNENFAAAADHPQNEEAVRENDRGCHTDRYGVPTVQINTNHGRRDLDAGAEYNRYSQEFLTTAVPRDEVL